MTLTISLPLLILLGISLALFATVTVLCHCQGLFDGGDGYLAGLDSLFTLILYGMFWAVPSLMAWAIWATWWR